jgi:disulfide bond formation protein DsbB
MQRLLRGAAMNIPRCDKPAFVFLGLSMAGWNAVVSLVLAVLSAVAGRLAYRRAEF